ncbi:MAG: chorismate synthase [Bacillales bacterium]|jgi:chorismate synthase|nr:chorismate synthase [Bacillales bacterium]
MRFLTAGESHGPKLTAIIEGLPAGLKVLKEDIDLQLERRQKGYGRGHRMAIETDKVEITSGIRHGRTIGSPVTLTVENKDWTHWTKIMNIGLEDFELSDEMQRKITRPRPGHADLVGGIKYGHRDMRNVLERSSARETTMRVAIGAIAKNLLQELGITVYSHVVEIGGVKSKLPFEGDYESLGEIAENSPVRCIDVESEKRMMLTIDDAKANGDTVGGIVEVIVTGLPSGVGSYVHYDRKIDTKIAAAIMSIQAFKGVEFGIGFEMAHLPGSQVHDEILWNVNNGYTRRTNRLGGVEGGMTTGMPLIVRAVMKPISTLYKPLQSVDIDTKEVYTANIERSDTCAVPAAAMIAENVVAWELAVAIVEQFYSDTMDSLKNSVELQRKVAREF